MLEEKDNEIVVSVNPGATRAETNRLFKKAFELAAGRPVMTWRDIGQGWEKVEVKTSPYAELQNRPK